MGKCRGEEGKKGVEWRKMYSSVETKYIYKECASESGAYVVTEK